MINRIGRSLCCRILTLAFWVGACLWGAITPKASFADERGQVLVFAAASLKDVVEAIGRTYTEKTGVKIVVSAAGSSALARQIDAGAPADLFFSANPDWVLWLIRRGHVVEDKMTAFAANQLVLVEAKADAQTSAQGSDAEVIDPSFLFGQRIAVGDPDHVPVGIYARRALEDLGVWEDVSSRLIPVDNTRIALTLVARGDVDQGIVYRTDAMIAPDVAVIGFFDEDRDQPIQSVAAVPRRGNAAEAEAFLTFVTGPDGGTMLQSYGFRPIERNE